MLFWFFVFSASAGKPPVRPIDSGANRIPPATHEDARASHHCFAARFQGRPIHAVCKGVMLFITKQMLFSPLYKASARKACSLG